MTAPLPPTPQANDGSNDSNNNSKEAVQRWCTQGKNNIEIPLNVIEADCWNPSSPHLVPSRYIALNITSLGTR